MQSQVAAKGGRSYVTVAYAKDQLTKCTSTAVQTDLTWPSSQNETITYCHSREICSDRLAVSSVSSVGTQKQLTDSTDPRDVRPPPKPQRRGNSLLLVVEQTARRVWQLGLNPNVKTMPSLNGGQPHCLRTGSRKKKEAPSFIVLQKNLERILSKFIITTGSSMTTTQNFDVYLMLLIALFYYYV